MTGPLEFRLLGSFEVACGDTTLTIPRGKQRTVLVKLLVSEGRPVTADELAELAWPALPQEKALDALYNTLSRLRKTFIRAGVEPPVVTSEEGYLLRRDSVQVDAALFQDKAALARVAAAHGDLKAARAILDEALSLRRPGEPLTGIDCPVLVNAEVPRLQRMLTDARENWCGIGLALNLHGEVLPVLDRLARENPLSESVHEKLIQALYETSGQNRALHAYHAIRARLADELGTDPRPSLQDLYLEIIGAPRRSTAAAGYPAKPRARGPSGQSIPPATRTIRTSS